jgi:quinol monooxygenase YgiN
LSGIFSVEIPGQRDNRAEAHNMKGGNMADKKVTVIAKFKAKAGKEEALKNAIIACVAPTRAEAGCINYDLHQSSDDKGLFMLYENWVSKKLLEEHLEMPYLVDLKAKAGDLCAEPIDIALWEMITQPE